jgi:predicted nucleic acid-binding protein
MRVVLDTTILIDYLRGRPVVDHMAILRRRGDVVLTTAINIEEVVRGLRPDEEAAAGVLFDGLGIVPLGRAEGRQAGEWRRTFAKRGVTLSQADCLIAAAAQAVAAVLATGNPAHFPMNDVTLEHWPVGQ